MREAIGGTFLFNIMIVFIFFFAAFLAIAINYSQAFRIKNQIINYIEQYEGMNNDTSKNEIVDYIKDAGYYRDQPCDCDDGDYSCGNTNDSRNGGAVSNSSGSYTVKGLCVRELENRNGDKYYRVTTFVGFELPVIGNMINFEVKGETKIITNN